MADNAFSWVNYVDSATLLAGAQDSNLVVANLKDRRLQKAWRSGASTSTYFNADFGANQAIDIIGLFGLAIGATDTVRIRLSTVSLGAGDVLDTTALASGLVDGFNQYVYLPASTKTARYMQIDIAAPSRSGIGYFDVGRAWAGPLFKPAINFSLGWGEGWKDDSTVEVGKRSGAVFVDAVTPYRTMDFTYDFLQASEKTQLMELQRIAGLRTQLLFVPVMSGDLARGPILGRNDTLNPLREPVQFAPSLYTASFSLKQDL